MKWMMLLFGLTSGLMMGSVADASSWAPRWTVKLTDLESSETKLYRVNNGPVELPSTPDGIQCELSKVGDSSGYSTRYILCRSVQGILVRSKTYVMCNEKESDQRALHFSHASYNPNDCNDHHDDKLNETFCLPTTEDAGVKIILRCD